MLAGYNARKAAQVVAYFALKAGGKINVLKISKLLYLVERESMKRFDEPMLFDKLVSMDKGPVASVSLNLINGEAEHEDWQKFVGARQGYDIGLAVKDLDADKLDQLSRADVRILDDLWAEFGKYNQFQLVEYTHKHCPEWEDPEGTSYPIAHREVFEALAKDSPELLAKQVRQYRQLCEALSEN